MGAAVTALVDDSSSLSWNPAGLARLAKPELEGSHVTLFESTSYDFVSAGVATQKWGGFGIGYLLQSSGGFEQRATPNDAPTTFSISQSAVMGGWGRAFGLPGKPGWMTSAKPVAVGVAVKQARESIASHSASGNGLDAGLLFQPQEKFAVGLLVRNLVAPKLTFASAPAAYPRTVEISPAYTWRASSELKAVAAVKLSKTENEALAASGGVELQYGKHAAVRAGMQDSGMSTGIGVRFGNSTFDYAVLLNDLGMSHLLSFTQRFGQTRDELEEMIRQGIQKLSYSEGAKLAKVYLARADDEQRAERVTEALKDLEAASLLDPENADIRAKIDRVKTRWDDSLRKQTVERTAALAREEAEQGNRLASRQYWRSVLELDPSNAQAKLEVSRIDEALSVEERTRLEGLREAQSAGEIAMALATASSQLSAGKLRPAKLEAEKALTRFPGNPQIQRFLDQVKEQLQALTAAKLSEADKLAEKSDFAGALRVVETALHEDPGNPKLVERGQVLRTQLQRGLTPEQRKDFEQLYYRAVEQYLKGAFKNADDLADELLRIDPSSESARTLKEKTQAALRYAP